MPYVWMVVKELHKGGVKGSELLGWSPVAVYAGTDKGMLIAHHVCRKETEAEAARRQGMAKECGLGKESRFWVEHSGDTFTVLVVRKVEKKNR